MFLTISEIVELTGRRYAKHQITWLSTNAWKFEVGADGHPKILRAYAESRMGAPKRTRPRLDGLAA